ncbi:phosphotransferase [Mycolicibacterium farcinogenes]|nr:phosphotransferase [Mycolicibacterium farcinogenes]
MDSQGRSPVADAAAARWGHSPGAALFWRSSASHVFCLGPVEAPTHFLRLDPASAITAADADVVAASMEQLAHQGFPVTCPQRSRAGRLTEDIITPLGQMTATLLPAAAGEWLEPDDLSEEQVAALGRMLATLHRTAFPGELPNRELDLAAEAESLSEDVELRRALLHIHEAVAALDPELRARGPVHGDLEPDNACFQTGRAMCYDFGEFGTGFLLRDVASAIREYSERPDLRDVFLDAYLGERGMGGAAESARVRTALAVFDRLQLAYGILELADVIDVGPDTHELAEDEQWVVELAADLTETLDADRRALFATAEGPLR